MISGFAASIALPYASGVTGNTTFLQSNASGVRVTQTISLTPPSAAPVLQSIARSTSASRHTLVAYGVTPLVYVTFTFNADISFVGLPGFTFLGLQTSANVSYYIAMFDPNNAASNWILPVDGPAAVSATGISFAGGSPPIRFAANTPYLFALYSAPSASPTSPATRPPAPLITNFPVRTPSPVPTASPSPIPTLSPTPTPSPSPTPFPPSYFSIDPYPISFAVGTTFAVTFCSGCAVSTPPVTYSAVLLDSTIASVLVSGNRATITGLAVGKTTLVVTNASGFKSYASVSINSAGVTFQ